jgi:hypothetical protein
MNSIKKKVSPAAVEHHHVCLLLPNGRPVRLAYQPPANSEQISTSHHPSAKRSLFGWLVTDGWC